MVGHLRKVNHTYDRLCVGAQPYDILGAVRAVGVCDACRFRAHVIACARERQTPHTPTARTASARSPSFAAGRTAQAPYRRLTGRCAAIIQWATRLAVNFAPQAA